MSDADAHQQILDAILCLREEMGRTQRAIERIDCALRTLSTMRDVPGARRILEASENLSSDEMRAAAQDIVRRLTLVVAALPERD